METNERAFSCAAASLTGHASNVTGASWTIATASAGDGLGHKVTIRNDSATDHSGKTVVLTGVEDGQIVTETLTAPGSSATVTSTKYYTSLTSAVPSATIGADAFDIGWTGACRTPWFDVNRIPAAVGVSVGGTINYDLQHSLEDSVADANSRNFDTATAKTASYDAAFITPVRKVRVDVNSHTSGTVVLAVRS